MESADSIPELLNRIILTSSPKSSKKTQNYLRQRDKVKITDQSKALFEQKRWFKTKKKRPRCIKVGNGPLIQMEIYLSLLITFQYFDDSFLQG